MSARSGVAARFAAAACVAGLIAPGAAAGAWLYDNTGNPANSYYSAQGDAEAIDDLHLISGGVLDSLVFEYLDSATGGAFSATVRLYANPGGLDLDLQPLAGPFVVNGLARGRGIVSIPLTPALVTGRDLWVGVKFTSPTAGLVLNDVPSAGSSHDLYYESGGYYWFGGAPKANFALRLTGTAENVSVDESPAAHVTLALAQPNPFHHATEIRYTIARPGPVRLEVRDVQGRRVRVLVAGHREAGTHRERWNGTDDEGRAAQPGIYFVSLELAGQAVTRRVALAR